MTGWFSPFFYLARCTENELRRQVEMLRSRVPKKRIFLKPEERERLLKLGTAIGPQQNAFIERWVKSIKFECLNFFLVFGQKHLDFLVSEYLAHYGSVRPHPGSDIGNKPLTRTWPEVDKPIAEGEQIVCVKSLGGVLKHYERRAA